MSSLVQSPFVIAVAPPPFPVSPACTDALISLAGAFADMQIFPFPPFFASPLTPPPRVGPRRSLIGRNREPTIVISPSPPTPPAPPSSVQVTCPSLCLISDSNSNAFSQLYRHQPPAPPPPRPPLPHPLLLLSLLWRCVGRDARRSSGGRRSRSFVCVCVSDFFGVSVFFIARRTVTAEFKKKRMKEKKEKEETIRRSKQTKRNVDEREKTGKLRASSCVCVCVCNYD